MLGWPIQSIVDSFIVLLIPVDPSQVYWMLTAAESSCDAVGAGAAGEHTGRRAQTWLALLALKPLNKHPLASMSMSWQLVHCHIISINKVPITANCR